MFGVKDPIPSGLRSSVVYKFTCAGCNACYVGKTDRHFSTRVKEHLTSDRASHIFKHLQNSDHRHASCSADCFRVLDHASTSFQLIVVLWSNPPLYPPLGGKEPSMIKFLPLDFLGASHKLPWKNKNAVYRLQISTLVPEILCAKYANEMADDVIHSTQ